MSAEEERLMQLFQNRAGLKKAYADLKDEFHLLRDRLKQQEGATIRVQEQLDALGDLLGSHRAILDGEIVAYDRGRPSFEALQARMHVRGAKVKQLAAEVPVTLPSVCNCARGARAGFQ